jgi:hypothetical protein
MVKRSIGGMKALLSRAYSTESINGRSEGLISRFAVDGSRHSEFAAVGRAEGL